MTIRIGRFIDQDGAVRVGMAEGPAIVDISSAGVKSLASILEDEQPMELLSRLSEYTLRRRPLEKVTFAPPIEKQEVWAAGVTYTRSKQARMAESNFSATAYDRVYEAERPELFFKCIPEKVVGPGDPVGIRKDAKWSVPEPELALVINSSGKVVGYTIGNDMSSRDIEGENLLYLPQAKIYRRSCALGPWITLGATEEVVRQWKISIEVHRERAVVFSGETSPAAMKRSFDELASFLFRSQTFEHGAVLLTGTGIVPPDTFTLQPKDIVDIHISGVGTLSNPVVAV